MTESLNLWKPEYLLDIDVIDEQHQGFFDLCMRSAMLCEAARSRPVQLADVIHLIYQMRAYAFRHFHTEETLLLKYGYPKIYGHMSLHDLFLRKLQEFTAELHDRLNASQKQGQEAFLASTRSINEYLANWWGEHIQEADRDYALFVRAHKGLKA